ncbi:MAG TPA: hypothetical protein VLQ89_06565 [Candidatus Binatia bacterium]|nr:hypothetical protein [Candidatus Binatia bacterium]
MNRLKLGCAVILLAGLGAAPLTAESEFRQQFSAWFALNDDTPSSPLFGLRYQPTLSLGAALGPGLKLDSEFSLDLSLSGAAPDWRDPDLNGRIKPYRLWLRLSSSRFEARLGLQKINFGSATIFRPLMWFDALDARDPLQITDGVYGLLLRYYFKSNANIWLWGLYGNDGVTGWETQPTADKTAEFGGRFQAPLFSGEAGVTVHRRRLDPGPDGALSRPIEERFAVDGKWDIGVGLWAEASFSHRDVPALTIPVAGGAPSSWQRSVALGVDYTFGLGNGLYLLAEHFSSQMSASAFGGSKDHGSFSALLARYPLGLLDNLGAVFYYDWRHERLYSFVSCQRTTDRWQFHVMVFWNPRQVQIFQGSAASPAFRGRGFQLMAVWNI